MAERKAVIKNADVSTRRNWGERSIFLKISARSPVGLFTGPPKLYRPILLSRDLQPFVEPIDRLKVLLYL
jgi:hypothetical protein